MMNSLFFKIFNVLINLIDYSNKKKILNFFKKKLKNKPLNIIDIGAHKGETIDFFLNNFLINRILAFEPNEELYNQLRKNNKYLNKNISIYNFGVGKKNEIKYLNIMSDSASSTFHKINQNTDYFKKKKRIISLFDQNKEFMKKTQKVTVINLSKIILDNKIKEIDILKIDTEGFEYNVLKGIENFNFIKIKYIYIEHHFDLMINKGYKLSDINMLLNKNNFYKKYKLKMKFRKSFEYIYENEKK
jgi:FkbM family methyltransferase